GPFILLHVRRIRLADGVLSVNAAGLFPHKVAVAQLDLARVRLVDLDAHPDFSPRVRLWGLGLPGFRAGHYLLRNRARAFCLLTRREQVLLLPRRPHRPSHLRSRLLPADPAREGAAAAALRWPVPAADPGAAARPAGAAGGRRRDSGAALAARGPAAPRLPA